MALKHQEENVLTHDEYIDIEHDMLAMIVNSKHVLNSKLPFITLAMK